MQEEYYKLPIIKTKEFIFSSLKNKTDNCSSCPLSTTPGLAVYGEGNIDANIMFVGEAPGETEAETGRPFVGRAGQLLDNMIASIGLSREDVYICNVVKHRPPNNRKPKPEEVEACLPFLHSQIQIVQPNIIVALGSTAIEALLGPGPGVTKRCGKWEMLPTKEGIETIRVLPMFHPSALLRNPQWKEPAWYGMQKVKKMYEQQCLYWKK